jgi:molybdate transport system regulatory protein
MQVRVKITIEDGEGGFFMGSGLVPLLEGIDRHRSISMSAREMRLSYPKALRMIRKLEGGLGFAVLIRRKGGNERGGAELTPKGREFLRRYERLQRRIARFSTEAFGKIFAGPLDRGEAP